MSINKSLKKAIDAIDLDRTLAEARSTAGELARKHGDKVEETVAKVGEKVDTKTKGKYADKLAAARAKVSEGVAKVASQPHVEDHQAPEPADQDPEPADQDPEDKPEV